MITFDKPTLTDLPDIKKILEYWTDPEGTATYLKRFGNQIKGVTLEFNLQFWVAKEDKNVVGIGGLCDPLPKILKFAKTEKPGELKILHLDNEYRGKGIGKMFIQFLQQKAKESGYKELLIRSAAKYKETAYRFYEKMGYEKVGAVKSDNDPELMQVFRQDLF